MKYDYVVVCDETNNSEEDIRNKRMNIDLYMYEGKSIPISEIKGRRFKIMSDTISKVAEIISKVKSTGNVKVMFVKKSDGTERIMNCTLDFERIPREHHPKKVEASIESKPMNSKSFLKVYDLEKNAWRGFIVGSLKWLSVGNRKYEIKLEE